MIDRWGWHMMGGWWIGALLMFLFFVGVTALVIWLIVRLVRSTTARPAAGSPPPAVPPVDPVLETLRRRLAEGAITVQEFDELRQKLGV